MATPSTFIFCSCQYGAQAILKQEILNHWPEFKFAFSRPGFVTFKVPEGFPLKSLPTLDLKSTFTRTSGICLGKVQAQDADELLKQAAELVSQSNLEIAKLKEQSGLINSFNFRDIEMAYFSAGVALYLRGVKLCATMSSTLILQAVRCRPEIAADPIAEIASVALLVRE